MYHFDVSKKMIIARYNDKRVRAEAAGSGATGTCPFTDLPVVAKVGEIRQYWVYQGGAPKLRNGYEPETEWHCSWKSCLEDKSCEVIYGTPPIHRADILGDKNTVIEVQHSSIDIRDVRERVEFYLNETNRRMVWIVDISEFWRKTFQLGEKEGNKYQVTWKPKRRWLYLLAQLPDVRLFLDYKHNDEKMLQAWVNGGKLYAKFHRKSDFFDEYLSAVAKPAYKNQSDLFVKELIKC